jgi:putative Holliday junction resolvase
MSTKPTSILAFDFGLSRIGVATGQTVTRTATPLTTLRARNGEPDWREVDALLREWRPDVILVGLPLNMDSTPSEMSERASAFARSLEQRYATAVRMVDERLTSFEARGLSDVEDARHAIAAQLIAQTYLGGSLSGGN